MSEPEPEKIRTICMVKRPGDDAFTISVRDELGQVIWYRNVSGIDYTKLYRSLVAVVKVLT